MPELSVVVPTRNRPRLLTECLQALAAELGRGDELLVVDSASTEAATREIARRAGARYVRVDRVGASAARNAGWRSAESDRVAFVDDDVRVLEGWRAAIAAGLSDATVGFVTGRVDVAPGDENVERPVALMTEATAFRIDVSTTGTFGATANCAVHRDVLTAVGGFDERLGPARWFAAAEDLDLFDRVLHAGYVGCYEPAARAVHAQWRRRSDVLKLEWRYGKGMGGRLALERRRDHERAQRLAVEALRAKGVAEIRRTLHDRYEFGAVCATVRTLGTVAGLAAGSVVLRQR